MDYEKAYKASLKTAAQWIKDGCTDKEKICLKCVFPELRESEDERIRMKLFHTVRGTPKDNEWFEEISKEAMLAWLEKQKERGPLTKEEEYTLHRIIEYLEDETCPPEWISLLHDIYCLPYEKQKEAKWSPSEGEMGVLYKLCYVSNQITDEDDTELTRLYQDLKREYFNGHSFENMFPSEKQKEQNECPEFCSGHCVGCEQKEQKPTEVKDPFSNANFVRGYESGYADAKREQKPAQTFEEKEYIRTLKSLISDFIRDKQPADVVYYQRVYDWLDERHIEQKPAQHLPKEKVFDIMRNLTALSYSERIPINSDEYGWIHKITEDVRSLLDYPIEQKPVDFPTTDEEVKEFLETHPKVKVPEKYKTSNFVFSKQEYESQPMVSKDTTSVKPVERSLEDDHIIGFIYDLLNEIEWKDNWAMSKDECLRRLKSLHPSQKLNEEEIKKIRSEEYTKGFNDAAFGGKLKEWSVEDEDRRRQIERIARDAGCTQKLQEEIHDWLKSKLK